MIRYWAGPKTTWKSRTHAFITTVVILLYKQGFKPPAGMRKQTGGEIGRKRWDDDMALQGSRGVKTQSVVQKQVIGMRPEAIRKEKFCV